MNSFLPVLMVGRDQDVLNRGELLNLYPINPTERIIKYSRRIK
jgi:hypothetical protein